MWAAIAKWVVTSVVLPIIHQFVAAWLKSREKAKNLKDKIRKNESRTEAYEKDPSDDNFSQLP